MLSDSSSDKGYMYAKIQVSDTYIHLFNTHLQATYNIEGPDTSLFSLSIQTRAEQIKILKAKIKKHLHEN